MAKPPRHPFTEEKQSSVSGIPYLPYRKFASLYQREGDPLGKGNTGTVFSTINGYAVKQFATDYHYRDLVVELDAHASLSHPCILRPLAWSYFEGVGYLVMKRGEKITAAYKANKISIEKIIFDTLSAVTFLNRKGILHCDLKPGNMLFVDGKCCLIDLGLAKHGILHVDGNYYVRGESAYTLLYRDPEYSPVQYNSMSCEIYSLFASYIHILENRLPQYGEVYTFFPKQLHLTWFFDEARLFHRHRAPIGKFLDRAQKQFGFAPYMGESCSLATSVKYTSSDCLDMLKWILELAIVENYKVEAVFLALDLFHRACSKTINMSDYDDVNLQAFVCACLSLATIVTASESRIISMSAWGKLTENTNFKFGRAFSNSLLDILKITRGVISVPTYWHCAKSKADLLPLLGDMLALSYDSQQVRLIYSDKYDGLKNVRMLDIVENLDQVLTSGQTRVTSLNMGIEPAIVDVTSALTVLEYEWDLLNEKPNQWEYTTRFTSALLHNRYTLPAVSNDLGKKIFTYLLKITRTAVSNYIIDTLCHFDWRHRAPDILSSDVNPFAVMSDHTL